MSVAVSMVMMTDCALPSILTVERELAKNWPDLALASETTSDALTLSFLLGESLVAVGLMPAPIPWADLEGPCATSVLWPSAPEEVPRHVAHLIITVAGELEAIPLSSLLTKVTAAMLAACPTAIGVYWGQAALVVPKPIFIDFAVEILPEGPPIHIWLDFRVGTVSPGRTSGFTTGMRALGHMEIETEDCPETVPDLRERLVGLVGYLLENGPVVRHGDTVGENESERIRVLFSPSSFGNSEQVMRLEYEAPISVRPWWQFWKGNH